MPGVGPWLSTELVPGYCSMISRLSVQPCFFCHSQNTRSTKQWWKKKIGSRPAVSFSPMSPLAPSIGETVVGRNVTAADRQMNAVMRRLQRHDRFGAAGEIFIPLRGRRRIGKHRVIRRVQAGLIFLLDVGRDHLAVHHDHRGQPCDDVQVQKLHIGGVVGVLRVVRLGLGNIVGARPGPTTDSGPFHNPWACCSPDRRR